MKGILVKVSDNTNTLKQINDSLIEEKEHKRTVILNAISNTLLIQFCRTQVALYSYAKME